MAARVITPSLGQTRTPRKRVNKDCNYDGERAIVRKDILTRRIKRGTYHEKIKPASRTNYRGNIWV